MVIPLWYYILSILAGMLAGGWLVWFLLREHARDKWEVIGYRKGFREAREMQEQIEAIRVD